MSGPGAGFIEGLLGGGEAGYAFRDRINEGKVRDRLRADLLTLRQQQQRDKDATNARSQTVFDEQQSAYTKAQGLRAEVARYLAAPSGPTPQIAGQTSMRDVERAAPGLSPDANVAMEVGRTLGRAGDVPLSDEQSLLVGSGAIPTGTFERLARARHTGRAANAKPPITEAQALAQVDNMYGIWEGGERTGHRLTPAQRITLARKMANGTAQASDFPDIPGEARTSEPPHAAEASSGPSWLDRIRSMFSGGGGGAAAASSSSARPAVATALPSRGGAPPYQPPATQQEAPAADEGNDLEAARGVVEQYRDLPPEEVEAALRDEGYSDEQIRTLLGSP